VDGCRRKCGGVMRAGGGEILEGDVVEYPLPEEVRQGGLYGDRIRYGLGAVSELVSDPSSSSLVCHIEPLVMVHSTLSNCRLCNCKFSVYV